MVIAKRSKVLWAAILTIVSFSFGAPAFAADPPAKCSGINECAEYIYLVSLEILKSVNTLPELVEAWIAPDEDSYTGQLQENFVQYINLTIQNDQKQIDDQKTRFMKDYFSNAKKPLPYVNQLTFTTLLRKEPFSGEQEKDAAGNPVDSAYNYIKNASGMNITHEVPLASWVGSEDAKAKYLDYYKTISAVQSFNTYVLSALYVDSQNNYNLSQKQLDLMKQASDPNWFVEVASENIGIVLRQILLFNSQTYVLLIKMFETAKQQLAAQSITNTLLIMGNQFTEKDLYNRATGNTSNTGF
jgi:hypothetical protein